MIIKKTPIVNSVFFSNNAIEIQLESEFGANHFFVLTININDVLFDVQSWGKVNDTDSFINLSGVFENIFTSAFTTPTEIEIVQNTALYKKISITVKEYNADTLTEVDTEVLPDFYLLQNSVAEEFNASEELFLLSELSALNKIDASSIISLPFWVNNTQTTFKVVSNYGMELFSSTIETQKGLYEFKIPVNKLSIAGLTDIKIVVSSSAFSISKTYQLKDNFRYSKTQLAIKNTFGFFEYCAFFGVLTKTPSYKRTIVETYLDVMANVADEHSIAYKLNTGFLTPKQAISIDKLNKSTDAYYLSDGVYRNIIITTKSGLEKETDVFAIDNELLFEDNYINPATEDAKYTIN